MNFKRILITGGAGFVGSNLAVLLRQASGDVAVTGWDAAARAGAGGVDFDAAGQAAAGQGAIAVSASADVVAGDRGYAVTV